MSGVTESAMGRGAYQEAAEDRVHPAPGDGGRPPPEAVERLGNLISTLEGEIIPRLMLVHCSPASAARAGTDGSDARVHPDDVDELTRLVRTHDVDVAMTYCRTLEARGVAVSSLYLDLLGPVARHLGELWTRDECSFTEVTLGLCRLHQMLRDLAPTFRGTASARGERRRALLLPAPGEQHMFGVIMVAEFFRRAGWDVHSGPAENADNLVGLVRNQWFGLVGLSVSTERGLDSLPRLIERLRRASRNRDLVVFVGGHVFQQQPELVAEVGADATGSDARTAALQAENLIATMV